MFVETTYQIQESFQGVACFDCKQILQKMTLASTTFDINISSTNPILRTFDCYLLYCPYHHFSFQYGWTLCKIPMVVPVHWEWKEGLKRKQSHLRNVKENEKLSFREEQPWFETYKAHAWCWSLTAFFVFDNSEQTRTLLKEQRNEKVTIEYMAYTAT